MANKAAKPNFTEVAEQGPGPRIYFDDHVQPWRRFAFIVSIIVGLAGVVLAFTGVAMDSWLASVIGGGLASVALGTISFMGLRFDGRL